MDRLHATRGSMGGRRELPFSHQRSNGKKVFWLAFGAFGFLSGLWVDAVRCASSSAPPSIDFGLLSRSFNSKSFSSRLLLQRQLVLPMPPHPQLEVLPNIHPSRCFLCYSCQFPLPEIQMTLHKGEATKAITCLALATTRLQVLFDRQKAIRLSGMSEKAYSRSFTTMQNDLGLELVFPCSLKT